MIGFEAGSKGLAINKSSLCIATVTVASSPKLGWRQILLETLVNSLKEEMYVENFTFGNKNGAEF